MAVGDPSVVRLELPVDARVLRVARLVASGVAATAGFDVEDVDDLRIAVDELCGVLFEVGDGSPVNLTFAIEDERVEIAGRTPAHTAGFEPTSFSTRFTLSDQILSAACDGHSWGIDRGVAYFSVYKRR